MLPVALLAGIGFTVSLLISELAVTDAVTTDSAELLMPATEIGPQLSAIDLAKAANLKRPGRTAMSALIRRARDLRGIDERRCISLDVQISQKGWNKIELVHRRPRTATNRRESRLDAEHP